MASPTLDEIAEVAGLEAALAMADARGGSRISLPAHPKQDSWLVKAVGMKAAQKICAHYRTGYDTSSGKVFDLPLPPHLGKRRQRIDALIRDGVSADKIAVQTKTHRTTVFRRKAKMQTPKKLPDLFD